MLLKLDSPPLNLICLAGLLLEPCSLGVGSCVGPGIGCMGLDGRGGGVRGICHASGIKDYCRIEFCHLFVGPLSKAGLVLSDRFRFDIIFQVLKDAVNCHLLCHLGICSFDHD